MADSTTTRAVPGIGAAGGQTSRADTTAKRATVESRSGSSSDEEEDEISLAPTFLASSTTRTTSHLEVVFPTKPERKGKDEDSSDEENVERTLNGDLEDDEFLGHPLVVSYNELAIDLFEKGLSKK